MNKIKYLLFVILFVNSCAYASFCIKPINESSYDYMSCAKSGLIKAIKNGKYVLLNDRGVRLGNMEYDNFSYYHNSNSNLIAVQYNGKWGFIDKSGRQRISFLFDEAVGFSEGRAVVYREQDGYYAVIDELGNFVVPYTNFEDVSLIYSNGFLGFKKNGKYGFMDRDGRVVIQPMYDSVHPFSKQGISIVGLDTEGKGFPNQYGAINKTGKIVIPIKYRMVNPANKYNYDDYEFISVVDENFRVGVVNIFNREILPTIYYNNYNNYSNGISISENYFKVALCRSNYSCWDNSQIKWGYVDVSDREIIPVVYDEIGDFSDGIATIKLNNKYGYIDKYGQEIVTPKFDDALGLNDGLGAVKLGGKWGYVDKSGRLIIPFRFDDARNFEYGLASVKLNGKWGFIDKTGNLVIQPRFDDYGNGCYGDHFREDGYAEVCLNGKKYLVHRTSRLVAIP